MDAWIARDDDGRLFLHFKEPFLDNVSGNHWQSFPYAQQVNIDKTPLSEKFKYLKNADKPVKIMIIL